MPLPDRQKSVTMSMRLNALAFPFPAIAGTHLPTPKGWKVE